MILIGKTANWLLRPSVQSFVIKKLSYRRMRRALVEILPIAMQQCRNYLYDKSWTNGSYEGEKLRWADV